MTKVIFDTNLYIDWFNRGAREDLFFGAKLARHLSAVVVMELRLGAGSPRARRSLDRLVRAYATAGRLVAPPPPAFDDAGRTLEALRRRGRDVRQASLVNDVLIAATARTIGATVYTRDRDFEAIRSVFVFSLELVAR